MRVVIAGGSGFLGSSLTDRFVGDGHEVVVLTRGDEPSASGKVRFARWTPNGETGPWAKELEQADAVVNLSGAGIADKRWSEARKKVIADSRILSTRSIARAFAVISRRPAVLIQGSGAGYYGSYDNGPTCDESSPPGSDFLGKLCVRWEAEALPVSDLGVRLAFARTSPVISKLGGALPQMMPPFKMFVGGPLGSGRQTMPWIHLDDWIGIVTWAIANPGVSGPLNLVTPQPITNAEFSQALGRALHRPGWLHAPAFALRIIVGEMADDALLKGCRILPKRVMELGYTFKYPGIDGALQAELG